MERTSRSRRPRLRRAPNQLRGNGSLMRTAPVALAHLGDDHAIARSAVDVSALTHGDPLAGEACVLWCIGIDRAVREGRLDGVRDGLALLESSSARRIERSFLVRSERLRRASPASRVRGHPADADPGRHALPSSPARVAGGGADRPRHRHRGRDRGGPAGGAMGRLRRALALARAAARVAQLRSSRPHPSWRAVGTRVPDCADGPASLSAAGSRLPSFFPLTTGPTWRDRKPAAPPGSR